MDVLRRSFDGEDARGRPRERDGRIRLGRDSRARNNRTARYRRPFRDQPRDRSASASPIPKRRRTSPSAVPSRLRNQQPQRVAYFLMGMPGCGKSTVKQNRFGHRLQELTRDFDAQCGRTKACPSQDDILDMNPDRLKHFHSAYQPTGMTAREDSTVHSWSVRTTARLVEKVCEGGARDFVVDSSGANPRWMMDRILDARGKYLVHLIFVDCPLEIALYRNRSRGAGGDGWVPEDVLIDKAGKVHATLQKLISEVDVVERVWSFDDSVEMLRVAQLDLYLFPAPRRHPPARPGDEDYDKVPSGACPPSTQPNSRRILLLANWKRDDRITELKRERLRWIDRTQVSREAFIIEDVFSGDTAPHLMVFERNKFPYQMPDRVEHWTLWAYQHLSHRTICDYVENHLRTKRPDVVSWNYDDNEDRRTVDIDHVHVYLSTRHDDISMVRLVTEKLATMESSDVRQQEVDGCTGGPLCFEGDERKNG